MQNLGLCIHWVWSLASGNAVPRKVGLGVSSDLFLYSSNSNHKLGSIVSI